MSIDLVHDDVEKSLIKVTLKQYCFAVCVTSGADHFFTYLHCNQEVEVIKTCQERMRRHLDRAVAQLA